MEFLSLFFDSLVSLSNAMAPYILFGLFLAGVLHESIPQNLVTKHLGKSNIASVLKSTLFGTPLPVCSCGVIPLAASMKKSGASKGATLSFLISTPITGVDSILATYGIFGFIFTVYRLVVSLIISIVAGIAVNIFDKEPEKQSAFKTTAPTECCCSGCHEDTKKFSLIQALHYGYVTLLGDIAKPLLVGLVVGALITTFLPKDFSNLLVEHPWLSYFIAVGIAVPMYVCATASLPIAAALMLSGVSAGAAFVFLSAGPATNMVTISIVKEMLGKRSLVIYLASIVIGSIAFGIALDYIFAGMHLLPASLVHIQTTTSVIIYATSVLLWGMVAYLLIKRRTEKI
jgi:uncharacterized protein